MKLQKLEIIIPDQIGNSFHVADQWLLPFSAHYPLTLDHPSALCFQGPNGNLGAIIGADISLSTSCQGQN